MNSAGLFSETNSVVAMTVQIDPRLSAKPRANPSTPNKATRAQVSILASPRPDAKIDKDERSGNVITLRDSALIGTTASDRYGSSGEHLTTAHYCVWATHVSVASGT